MKDKLSVVAVLFSVFALLFSLFVMAGTPTEYDDLDDLPDLFDVGDIPVVDLSHGLVLHLPFDRSDADKSGYGFDASTSGLVDVDGYFDGAKLFDDTADSCLVSSNSVLNFSDRDFSVSFWLYLVDNSSQMELYHREAGADGWRISVSVLSGVLDVIIVDPTYTDIRFWDGTFHFQLGQYYHVLLLKNSSYISWYIDGVLDGVSSDISGIVFSSSTISIGNGYGVNLDGALDDVRVYNRVLSSYERLALYGLGV